MTKQLKMRRWWVLAATLAVAGSLVVPAVESASALSGSQFDAGYIISDANFYNASAMTEGEIQNFLDMKIGTCTNGLCLNVLRMDTFSRAADRTVCGAYAGAAGERASAIIFKVQQACGISAKALLVTLQKEQGLVTSKGPSSKTLERAMGYGCPDSTPGVCDSSFYGFYNQVYKAAWQFKRYSTPDRFGNYQPGMNSIAFNQDAVRCPERASVNIRNNATAALYNYTPYVPNASALANLRGMGDSCGAYGNRNFWVFFNDWFGSTTGPTDPFGVVDAVSASAGQIHVQGWAIDPDTADPITVHVYIDNTPTAIIANGSRPDVAAVYPESGALHGFSNDIAAPAGDHVVCLYGINVGPGTNAQLTRGCWPVSVPNPPGTIPELGRAPFGVVDSVTPSASGFSIAGWAIDPDTAASIRVHVYVDGVAIVNAVSDKVRVDVAAAYPGYGANHGYAETIATAPGSHSVCAYAINAGPGPGNTALGCHTITVR